MFLPFQVYVAGMSWIDEPHAHLMLDPSCEPFRKHGSDLIWKNIKPGKETRGSVNRISMKTISSTKTRKHKRELTSSQHIA